MRSTSSRSCPSHVEAIIERERPDALLATLGGQTGLNLAVVLADRGALERHGVRLLGTPLQHDPPGRRPRAVQEGDARRSASRCPNRRSCADVEEGLEFAQGTGYPLVVRPAYTLGGTGGGIAHDASELRTYLRSGSSRQHRPPGRCSRRRCSAGRRSSTKCCATAPTTASSSATWRTSIRWACTPAIRSSSRPRRRCRTAIITACAPRRINIIRHLQVEGGCNIQFALDPRSDAYNDHRSQSARLALVRAGEQSDRLSDRQDRDEDRAGQAAPGASPIR